MYSTTYEQAKRDVEIEKEKTAKIKTEQLEGLRKKEKKVPTGTRPIKWKDHHVPRGSTGSRVASYQPHQRLIQFQRSRMLPSHSPVRDSYGMFDQMNNNPYHHSTMSHHPQSMKVSRSDAPIPLPAQNNITRERAMHMIDQSQSCGRYTFLKAPLDEVYHVVKSRGLLYPSTPIAKLPNR